MMPPRFATVLLVVLLWAPACAESAPVPAESPAGLAKSATSHAPSASATAGFSAAVPRIEVPMLAAKAPITPTLTVEEVTGNKLERVRAIFAATQTPMRECAAGTSGAIRVRVRTEASATRLSVEPGSSLGAPMHRCMLEALSTVDIESLRQASPSDRPSGFSSLLTVAW